MMLYQPGSANELSHTIINTFFSLTLQLASLLMMLYHPVADYTIPTWLSNALFMNTHTAVLTNTDRQYYYDTKYSQAEQILWSSFQAGKLSIPDMNSECCHLLTNLYKIICLSVGNNDNSVYIHE